jgi:methylenetetrahydrofolate reductase (NADPH)
MKLTDLFRQGEFVFTGEVGPIKGCCRVNGGPPPEFVEEAAAIKDYVHAVNVADNQSALMRLGSLAASVLLKSRGVEPIFQLTCRDRNRIALQSDLLSACSLGIDNVLCLTGDHIKLGDHTAAKAVFDVDSVQLLKMAKGLNEGRDMMGHPLSAATDLALSAVVNPGFEPLDLQLLKM